MLGQTAQADAACKQLLASPDLAEIDILSILPVLLKHHAEDLATRFLKGLEHRGLSSATTLKQLGGLQEERGQFKEARDTLERTEIGATFGCPCSLNLRALLTVVKTWKARWVT